MRPLAGTALALALGASPTLALDGASRAQVDRRPGRPGLAGLVLLGARSQTRTYARRPGAGPLGLAEVLPSGVSPRLLRRRGRHTTLGFQAQGLPVEPTRLTVTATPRGRVLVGGLPARAPRGAPPDSRGSLPALAAARAHTGAGPGRPPEVGPCWIDQGPEGLVAGWRVRLRSRTPPGDWLVLVDADGQVVLAEDQASPAEATYEGVGAVWEVDPAQGPLVERTLTRRTHSSRLKGLDVRVENEDTMDASAREGRFVYPAASKHADEVMVYFHVQRAAEYFRGLGFQDLPAAIPAAVYYGQDYDNAMFLGWAGALVFGDGHRYNPLSRDASVIVHEYAHAVTYQMTRLGSFREAGAMNEGFSDYFAGALTGSSRVGVYTVAPTGRPFLRDMVNELTYPEDMTGESHDDARIFAGALWALRQRVGGEVADRLVHECRGFLNREAGFLDARQALRQLDAEHHGGAHDGAIVAAFGSKGIVDDRR